MAEKLWTDDMSTIFIIIIFSFHIMTQTIYPHDWGASQDTQVTTVSLRSSVTG